MDGLGLAGRGDMKQVLDARNIAYCVISLIASAVIGAIGFSLLEKFPSLEQVTCPGPKVSGCLEWSIVFFGPFYLLFYALAYALVLSVALLPVALGLLQILRRKRAGGVAESGSAAP